MAIINWRDLLSTREIMMVDHAEHYSSHYKDAAIPGHNQFLFIAKLISICDELQDRANAGGREIVIKKVVYDSANNCWRDVETGVKTEVP